MTNIDIASLATVVGGKAATAPTTSTASSTTSSAAQSALTLGGDALQGCLTSVQGQGTGAAKATTKGAQSAQSLGLTCALGAGEGFIKGLGSLFGGASAKK